MNKEELYKELGCSDEEIALLNVIEEAKNVSEIARLLKIRRAKVYKMLRRLVQRSLVMEEGESRKLYRAVSIGDIQMRLRALLGEGDIIPESDRTHMRYLESAVELREVMEDILKTLPKGGALYRYSSRTGKKDISQFSPDDYVERRNKNKLQQRVIVNGHLRAGLQKDRMECLTRVIKQGFEHDIAQLIYGNKVAIVDFEEEKAWIFDHDRLASFQRDVFMELFKRL